MRLLPLLMMEVIHPNFRLEKKGSCYLLHSDTAFDWYKRDRSPQPASHADLPTWSYTRSSLATHKKLFKKNEQKLRARNIFLDTAKVVAVLFAKITHV